MLHTDASLAFVLKKRSKFTLFVTNMYSLQDLASHAVVFRGVILLPPPQEEGNMTPLKTTAWEAIQDCDMIDCMSLLTEIINS